MIIYFIRHGKTEANTTNKWQGAKTDLDLSQEGINEIDELIKTNNIDFDVIYSSPLKRALQTAQKIAKNNDKNIIISDSLIERDFGKLESQDANNEDKNKLADWDLNTDLGMDVEKIQDMFNLRVKPFVEKIKKENNENKKIAIVSHSWVGRLLSFLSTNDKNQIKIAPINAKLYKFKI